MTTITDAAALLAAALGEPPATRTPVKDFLLGLLDDAYGYRLPGGDCWECARTDTGRCPRHQDDEDRVHGYLSIFKAVDSADGDEDAFHAFVAALPDGRG